MTHQPDSPSDDALRDALNRRQAHVDATADPHLAYSRFNDDLAPVRQARGQRWALPAAGLTIAAVLVALVFSFRQPTEPDALVVGDTATPSAQVTATAQRATPTPATTPIVEIPTPFAPTTGPVVVLPTVTPMPAAPTPDLPPTDLPPTDVTLPVPTTCTTDRYTVTIPDGWYTTDTFRPCALFSPAPIELPGETEYVLEVDFYWTSTETYQQALDRIETSPTIWEINSQTTTEVDGQPATRLAVTGGPDTPNRDGFQILYVIDLVDGVLFSAANQRTDNSQASPNYAGAQAAQLDLLDSITLVVGEVPDCSTTSPPDTWDQTLADIIGVDFNADGQNEIIVPEETNAAGFNYGIYQLEPADCTWVEVGGVNDHFSATVSNFGCRPNADGTTSLIAYQADPVEDVEGPTFTIQMWVFDLENYGLVQADYQVGSNSVPSPGDTMPPFQTC